MNHRDAAIHCEMKKCGLRQSKDGIIVSFVLHPQEVPKQLQTAEIGSRWMVALVELGDDEQPAKEEPAPEPHSGRVAWRDMTPASQCAIRLSDPVFLAFLAERYEIKDEKELKTWLEISSKTELSTNHKKRVLWHQLDEQFLAWKIKENT